MFPKSPVRRLRRLVAAVLAACLLVLLLPACTTAPVTGRHQFIAFSEETEAQMGLEAFTQFMEKAPVSTNAKVNDQVLRVGKRIAEATGKDYKWEFKVVADDKTVNAFCLPGGKVVVYTGILPVAKDDTGLAVVMGHEIAHATARHGGERMTTSSAIQFVLKGGEAGLTTAFKMKDPAVMSAVSQAFGFGAQVGELKFSRNQESEADEIGIIYMAKAGYDPSQAVEFWKRMATMTGGASTPQWLSTHPSHETRVEDLEKLLPKAKAEYEKSPYKGK